MKQHESMEGVDDAGWIPLMIGGGVERGIASGRFGLSSKEEN